MEGKGNCRSVFIVLLVYRTVLVTGGPGAAAAAAAAAIAVA